MKKLLTSAATAVAVVLALTSCMSSTEMSGFSAVNNDRSANGVATLTANDPLTTKAQGWAKYLLDNAGGQCSMTVLHHSTLANGAPTGWKKLGENVGCVTATDPNAAIATLESAFMGSIGHRENILDPAFNNGAIGMAWSKLPNGLYLVFEAQEFAEL